jgi:hypothetical protein
MSEKVLVSASGKGHSAIATWWVISLVGAVLCVAVGIFAANQFGYSVKPVQSGTGAWGLPTFTTENVKNGMYNVMMAIGAITAVLCVIQGIICQTRMSKTAVSVYNSHIKGSSVVPKFPLSFVLYGSISSLSLTDFHLTYDQVSSVDVVNGNTLIINATNVQHKIYAMNAGAVRDAIVAQKKAVGQAA